MGVRCNRDVGGSSPPESVIFILSGNFLVLKFSRTFVRHEFEYAAKFPTKNKNCLEGGRL